MFRLSPGHAQEIKAKGLEELLLDAKCRQNLVLFAMVYRREGTATGAKCVAQRAKPAQTPRRGRKVVAATSERLIGLGGVMSHPAEGCLKITSPKLSPPPLPLSFDHSKQRVR